MRRLNAPPQGIANETMMSHHFSRFALNQPEVLAQAATLYRNESSAFTSLLADRGMIAGPMSDLKSKGYTMVGSKRVRWHIEGLNNRVANIVKDYECAEYPTEPGKNQSIVFVYLDTNWFSPRDVVELADNRTLIYFFSDKLPEEYSAGVFKYQAKLVTKSRTDSINPELLKVGHDMSVLYNMYEEASETAYEKYTFHEWAETDMTIMRLKWSMSGTAEAMKMNTVQWFEHNGQATWMSHAQAEMMRRWAEYRENAILFGQGTVGDDGKTIMHKEDGVEVTAGDGLLNQGDGVWKIPYSAGGLSTKLIDTLLGNMSLNSSYWSGHTDVAVVCGHQFFLNFQTLMKGLAGSDPKVVVDTKGGGKAIDLDYDWYKYGGIRFIPVWHKYFDRLDRAGAMNVDQWGHRIESHRAIFVSLGNIDVNKPQIELLALGDRAAKMGTVNGINKGGDMANSVDATHHHILTETGIANKDINGIAEMFVPISTSNFYVNRR